MLKNLNSNKPLYKNKLLRVTVSSKLFYSVSILLFIQTFLWKAPDLLFTSVRVCIQKDTLFLVASEACYVKVIKQLLQKPTSSDCKNGLCPPQLTQLCLSNHKQRLIFHTWKLYLLTQVDRHTDMQTHSLGITNQVCTFSFVFSLFSLSYKGER